MLRLPTSLKVVWASPNSLLGLLVGAAGLLSGGRVQRRGRTLEFYGGGISWVLDHLPAAPGILAMTLGHVILGQTAAALDIARDHEAVHVVQYEKWGPLMLPAYLFASLVLYLRGADPYRDNPFEREAYRISP